MKLRLITYFILLLTGFLACCNNVNHKAYVEVNINNLETDTILISLSPYYENQSYQFDTIICRNGKFHFDTLISELNHGFIISKKMYTKLDNGQAYFIRSKSIEFFLSPNEKLKITGTNYDYKTDHKLYGNKLNTQLNDFNNSISDSYAKIIKLDMQIENHYINNSSDSIINNLTKEQRKLYQEKLEAERTYIKTNSASELSAFLLNKQRKDTIIKYYPKLSTSVKESQYGKLLENQINSWKRFKVGSKAPDFKHPTINNDTFRLSNQLGKIVILDFWGTWCKSCIKGIPKMKEYHSKYKEETIFISIACRDSKTNLVKAVNKYKLPWIQILNKDNSNYNILKKYTIEGFPTKVIINKEGIIEGIFLGETNEFYDKIDQLLK